MGQSQRNMLFCWRCRVHLPISRWMQPGSETHVRGDHSLQSQRVDAIVGDELARRMFLVVLEKERRMRLGIVWNTRRIRETLSWKAPASTEWDYRQFANAAAATKPDETCTLTFV